MTVVDDPGATSREQIFDFIVAYKRANDGLSPAISEIAEVCSLSSSTVKYHLLNLVAEKRITIVARRGILVIGGEWDLPGYEPRESPR